MHHASAEPEVQLCHVTGPSGPWLVQDKELIQKQKEALQQSQQLHKDEVQRLHKSLQAAKKEALEAETARQPADVAQQSQWQSCLTVHAGCMHWYVMRTYARGQVVPSVFD